ncbi:MAG: response regulator [Acidimicrobiia bacterium]|nr:response regulator [Acidimicrobiia bacterium]
MRENKVVLVIDDVKSVLQLIRAALIDHPVDVLTAIDGGSGLALAQEITPDLVLLDLALPVMDGWEILAALRADPATRNVPVVIVTAHGDSDTASRARELGADGFIAKPFRPAELRRIIEGCLHGPTAAAS